MDEQDLKAIGNLLDKKLDEKLNQNLEPIKKDLEEIKETTASHTSSLMNLERDIKSYNDALDVERKRINKREERISELETL